MTQSERLDEHHSRRTSLIERFSELGAKPPQPAGFEPNVFTTIFPMINDHVQLTVTGANCGLPTVGAARVVLEPKPGLPTDPNNPSAFNDVFTDISPLFVINNENGWYEGG